MRITFVLPGYPWKPVGGFRVVYEYANRLVARGHEVIIVHSRRLPNWSPPPPPNLYYWVRRKVGYLRDLIFRPTVRWQPIDPRVQMLYVPEPTPKYVPDADAVFATWWATAELVAEYPLTKGKKFYLVQDFGAYFGPKTRLEDTWRKPFKKVVISSWLYKQLLEIGVPQEDVALIPNGIDLQRFRLIEDIERRPKRVAMMYSNASYKAPEDGVKALEICKAKHKDLAAVCFGPGRRPRSLPSWIEYNSNIPEDELIKKIYNGSRIFLSSSIAEGFAMPPAEAMACGCAVVATDSGGIREYAEHEKTALLSPPGDPEALTKNLLRLLEDDDLRIQLAKAGHKRIQEFTWDRSTDLLEQFLIQHVRI